MLQALGAPLKQRKLYLPSSFSPTKNNETNVLQSETPLVDLVQSNSEPVTSPVAVISVIVTRQMLF